MTMTNDLPGGEYGKAWASMAAASRGKRRTWGGPYAGYKTEELLRDLGSSTMDEATRTSIQAEVDRRLAKRK